MLRFDFMASDFNEHFLILGTPTELSALAETLRRYAKETEMVDLSQSFPNPALTVSLLIEPPEGARQGLHQTGTHTFRWCLHDWQAAIIADGIDKLNTDRSASEIFQLGAEGEIPVKISHGEFTDEFLVSKW